MASFDPIAAVGMLFTRRSEGNALDYLGSCVLFRHNYVCVTAAHCVKGVAVERLLVVFPRLDHQSGVRETHHHWTKDIAVLILASPPEEANDQPYPDSAFWNCVSNYGLGEEFMAYGYPESSPSSASGAVVPTARLVRGHIQRIFNYLPPGPHSWYAAGEMSIPAPTGLSGGPVFRPGATSMLIGLVTSNLESYTLRDYEERLDEGGEKHIFEARRIVSYGITLLLDQVAFWLRYVVPERSGMGSIQGPEPSQTEIGFIVHDLVERGGGRYRDSYFFPESRLVVHGHDLSALDESVRSQLSLDPRASSDSDVMSTKE